MTLDDAAKAQVTSLKRRNRRKARESRARREVLPLDPVKAAEARIEARDIRREAERPKPKPKVVALDKLLIEGRITQRQADAGNRLYADWVAGGAEPLVVGSYGNGSRGHDTEVTTSRDKRRQRCVDALRAVGVIASNAVVHACLIPQEVPHPVDILRSGLDRLADFYS